MLQSSVRTEDVSPLPGRLSPALPPPEHPQRLHLAPTTHSTRTGRVPTGRAMRRDCGPHVGTADEAARLQPTWLPQPPCRHWPLPRLPARRRPHPHLRRSQVRARPPHPLPARRPQARPRLHLHRLHRTRRVMRGHPRSPTTGRLTASTSSREAWTPTTPSTDAGSAPHATTAGPARAQADGARPADCQCVPID
jgi:hypothetical protein